MNPLDQKADYTFLQALHCVQYRFPQSRGLTPTAYLLALSLRYGLIGAASAHHLLLTSEADELDGVSIVCQNWSEVVEEHIRQVALLKLPFRASTSVPPMIGQLAYQPVGVTLRLYRHFCPLDRCLTAAAEQFMIDHKRAILQGVPWLKRRKAMKAFYELTQDSLQYARNFFERRQYDLEEVAEIALIGE